jgi:PIN domain nuclease of toxin-antitoxin system
VNELLLDTHSWIWSVENDTRRLGRRARALVSKADLQERLRVSPASIFEVVALHTAGRLRLAGSAEPWIRDALAAGGIRLAELTAAIAVDAGLLPRAALPDPVDRLLVATARKLDATLLTGDRRILEYASATASVRVHDAAA